MFDGKKVDHAVFFSDRVSTLKHLVQSALYFIQRR